MKKVALVLGALFIVLIVAIVSIPLFVDVDQYRPTITAEANKRINGQLELGKLKLSLWGAIKIHAESIVVKVNGFNEPMLDTKQFHLEIPFGSVLSGKPQIIAVLDEPKILVRKETNGKMNVLELMKVPGASAAAEPQSPPDRSAIATPVIDEAAVTDQVVSVAGAPKKDVKSATTTIVKTAPVATTTVATTATATSTVTTPTATPATQGSLSANAEPTKVPAIVAGARLGVTINKGEVHYLDKVSKAEYHVDGLDLKARDLGLGSKMNISLTAPVKGTMPKITFEGPITAEAEITPVLVDNMVKSVKGTLSADASKLAVMMEGGVFAKTPAMPLTLKTEVDGNEKETLIRSFELRFYNYQIHGKGRATAEPVTAQVDISTEPLRLNELHEFVPMVAAYDLKGIAGLNVKVDYSPAALKANGDMTVKDGSIFMKDVLKAPMEFQMQGGFTENTFNLVRATVTAPESDLQLVGDVKNFLPPQFNFSLTGKSFNVDKTLVLPAMAQAPAKTAWLLNAIIAEALAAEGAQVNPMLAMAKNPVLANAAGTFTGKINRVTAYNANFDEVSVKTRLQNLVMYIPEASLKTFGGSVKANGEADLKAPALSYKTAGSVAGVSAKQAFSTYFPKYKDTFEGTTDANWNVGGVAFPPPARIRSIKGTAKFIAHDGVLKSVDVQDTINKATEKVPFLKGKKVQLDDGFKTLTADVKFDNGMMHVEPVDVQPRGKGFVLKGKSAINMETLVQDTYLDVFDPQGILPKELAAGAGKAALPFHITGLLTGPQVDYEYTIKHVAGNAGKNVLKDQAGKALDKFLGNNNAPTGDKKQDAIKKGADQLKKLFKF